MNNPSLFDDLETGYGMLYPTGYIVATFLTESDAEQIASALATAQFSDIRMFNNQELLDHIAETQSRQSLMDRRRTTLDEAEVAASNFLAQLKAGSHAVLVLAENDADIQRALPILRTENPQVMYHYENWTTTTLS